MSLDQFLIDFMDTLTMVAVGVGLSLGIVALVFVPLIVLSNRVHKK